MPKQERNYDSENPDGTWDTMSNDEIVAHNGMLAEYATQDSRHRLVVEWNNSSRDYPYTFTHFDNNNVVWASSGRSSPGTAMASANSYMHHRADIENIHFSQLRPPRRDK